MKILAFAEQRDNKLKKTAFEVVWAANMIADPLKAEVIALVMGDSVQGIAGVLCGYGASRVIVVEDPRLGKYSATAYSKVIAEVCAKEESSIIMLSATAMGKDCGPRVAARLDSGIAVDCTALGIEGGEILATRPVYAGKALADVKINSRVKIFSLRPNVFSAGTADGSVASVERMDVQLDDKDFVCKVVDVTQSAGKVDVAEADIIVTGGRGLRGPENFAMIEELATVLGGAVGASRAVVDAGWRPHDEQVGQTGKTVSPSLYIAVAVSGAIQHLAGMSSSKYIVAVNKDKDAPIFQVADYGIVGDAFEIIPALTKEIKKLQGK